MSNQYLPYMKGRERKSRFYQGRVIYQSIKSGDCKSRRRPLMEVNMGVIRNDYIYIHGVPSRMNASERFFYKKLFISRNFRLNISPVIYLTIMLNNAPKPVHFQPTNIISNKVFSLHTRFLFHFLPRCIWTQ